MLGMFKSPCQCRALEDVFRALCILFLNNRGYYKTKYYKIMLEQLFNSLLLAYATLFVAKKLRQFGRRRAGIKRVLMNEEMQPDPWRITHPPSRFS